MRQALRTCVDETSALLVAPMADPPPVRGHTGATTEPTTRPKRAHLVGQPLQIVIGESMLDVRVEQEQIHAVEFHAVHFRGGREGAAWYPDRWAVPNPDLCRPGRATWRCVRGGNYERERGRS